MPPEVIHVTWVNPSMGHPIIAEHFKLLHCKKMSDHSTFDGTCLHDICAYCVNVGQDILFI